MGVGGPVAMEIFLVYLGIAASVPFIGGLLGYSRRLPYLMTAAFACGMFYLDAVTFSDALKYQDVFGLVLLQIEFAAIFIVELLFAFVLAHWLGVRFRVVLIRIKDRSRRMCPIVASLTRPNGP